MWNFGIRLYVRNINDNFHFTFNTICLARKILTELCSSANSFWAPPSSYIILAQWKDIRNCYNIVTSLLFAYWLKVWFDESFLHTYKSKVYWFPKSFPSNRKICQRTDLFCLQSWRNFHKIFNIIIRSVKKYISSIFHTCNRWFIASHNSVFYLKFICFFHKVQVDLFIYRHRP